MYQQNPPVLNWRCWLTQVDLYSGRKMVVGCSRNECLVAIAMGSSSRGSNIVIVLTSSNGLACGLDFFSTSKPLKKRALFFRLALTLSDTTAKFLLLVFK